MLFLRLVYGGLGWWSASTASRLVAPGAAGAATAWTVMGLGLAVALVFGAQPWLGEWWAQDHVHKLRMELLAAEFDGASSHSGLVMVRASSDLLAVKQWVALGVVPALGGAGAVLGIMAAVVLADPAMAAVLGAVISIAGATVIWLGQHYGIASQHLRRARGRLAVRVGDDLKALATIQCVGRPDRELRVLSSRSRTAQGLAVRRAATSSLMRVVALWLVGLWVPLTFLLLSPTRADLTRARVLGALLSPLLLDLGRAVEFRQAYRAALATWERALSRRRSRDMTQPAWWPPSGS